MNEFACVSGWCIWTYGAPRRDPKALRSNVFVGFCSGSEREEEPVVTLCIGSGAQIDLIILSDVRAIVLPLDVYMICVVCGLADPIIEGLNLGHRPLGQIHVGSLVRGQAIGSGNPCPVPRRPAPLHACLVPRGAGFEDLKVWVSEVSLGKGVVEADVVVGVAVGDHV